MDSKFQVLLWVFLRTTAFGKPLLPNNKLSLATWGSYYHLDHMGPGTYAFGYDIEDPVTGNVQFKQEERHPNGTVTGNYGYVDADGKPHVVTYVSDHEGYRAKLEIEGQPMKYFPPVSTSEDVHQPTPNHVLELDNPEELSGQPPKQNLLTVPLQGSFIQPGVPDDSRLNYPTYYGYVGANAVAK